MWAFDIHFGWFWLWFCLPSWFKISDLFLVFSDFWQDSPNMASRAPQRRPKTAPRASQERPRPPQDCPKNISERPNSVPGAAKSDLRTQKHRKIHKTIQKHGKITKNVQQPAGTQKTMQKIVQINWNKHIRTKAWENMQNRSETQKNMQKTCKYY